MISKYFIISYSLFFQEAGDIVEVSIGRSSDGFVETVASAFTHLNNAWHDAGVHFSNISLPLNSHVNSTIIGIY